MSVLTVNAVRVAVDGGEAKGLAILCDDVLVAVLSCLDDAMYGTDQNQWFLEAGFGKCAAQPGTFATMDAALRWIASRLQIDPASAVPGALDRYRQSPSAR